MINKEAPEKTGAFLFMLSSAFPLFVPIHFTICCTKYLFDISLLTGQNRFYPITKGDFTRELCCLEHLMGQAESYFCQLLTALWQDYHKFIPTDTDDRIIPSKDML